MLPNFAIRACRTESTYGFLFTALEHHLNIINVSILLVRKGKMRCFTIFEIKVCSPLDPANPLYYRHILSIYTTIYVSGKLGQVYVGGGGVGTIFSKPQKMSGQTPVWKNTIK